MGRCSCREDRGGIEYRGLEIIHCERKNLPQSSKFQVFEQVMKILQPSISSITISHSPPSLPLASTSPFSTLFLTFQTPNLIAQQHFRAHTLPPPVSSSGDHKPTRRIDMQSADNTGAMARNDEEGNCAASVFDIAEIVEAEDIIRCTGSFISISHANKEGIRVEG